jgi:hypothetical protein
VRLPPWIALTIAVLLSTAAPASEAGWSQRSSSHFQLFEAVGFARYSGADGSLAFERGVLSTLETAHERVRDSLKVEPRYRVKVYVYEPSVFDAEYASRFGFRAAGFWDGAIHVRGGRVIDARLVGTLHHEYLHAALDSLAPRDLWPAWMNEGLAEYFERLALGQKLLSGPEDARLRGVVASGAWIPLAELSGPTLSGLSQEPAEIAYLESYAMMEMMFRISGPDRVKTFVRELARTRMLDRALQSAFHATLAGVEAQLISQFR